jgi:hypothetical protein
MIQQRSAILLRKRCERFRSQSTFSPEDELPMFTSLAAPNRLPDIPTRDHTIQESKENSA